MCAGVNLALSVTPLFCWLFLPAPLSNSCNIQSHQGTLCRQADSLLSSQHVRLDSSRTCWQHTMA